MAFRGRAACVICGCYPTAQTHRAADAAPWCDLADPPPGVRDRLPIRVRIHDHCAAYHFCTYAGCLTGDSPGGNVSPAQHTNPKGSPVIMTDANVPLPLVTGDDLREVGVPQPSPRELSTRGLIVVIPRKTEQRKKFESEELEDAVIADVIIPGTGVWQYGEVVTGKTCPPRLQVTLPAKLTDVIFRGHTIWDLQRAVGTAAVLGRIEQGTKGTKGNPPWLFNKPTENDPGRPAAVAAYSALAMAEPTKPIGINGWDIETGTFPGVVGTAAAIASAAAPATVTQTATATMTWEAFSALPAPAQAALTAAGAAPARPAAVPALPPGFTTETWATLDATAQAATLAAFGMAPATPAVPAAPPGFEGTWAGMTDAQRTQILTALGQSPAVI